MTFDWDHYLKLADDLHTQTISGDPTAQANLEAIRRTIISRAYYAAFRVTRDYLDRKNIYRALRKGIDHKNVKDHSARVDPIIRTNLTRLIQLRTYCDYDNPFPTTETLNEPLVLDSINKARTVIQIIHSKPP